jgi:hypothetical protein
MQSLQMRYCTALSFIRHLQEIEYLLRLNLVHRYSAMKATAIGGGLCDISWMRTSTGLAALGTAKLYKVPTQTFITPLHVLLCVEVLTTSWRG